MESTIFNGKIEKNIGSDPMELMVSHFARTCWLEIGLLSDCFGGESCGCDISEKKWKGDWRELVHKGWLWRSTIGWEHVTNPEHQEHRSVVTFGRWSWPPTGTNCVFLFSNVFDCIFGGFIILKVLINDSWSIWIFFWWFMELRKGCQQLDPWTS